MIKHISTAAIGLSAVLVPSSGTAQQKNESPNIILVMADDLGWGDTGYNGHERIKTPNLDQMSKNGVTFSRFYAAAPVSSPTRGSCLTGRNPYRYGITNANTGHLKKEEISVAELAKEKGYATGHFGKWHLGTLFSDFSGKGKGRLQKGHNHLDPSMAGFDEWFSTEFAVATYDPYKKDREHAHSKTWLVDGDRRTIYVENGKAVPEDLTGCDSKIIMDRALSFIEKSVKSNRKFLTVIWFHAPHEPVVGHPKYMKELYADLPENQQHYYSVVTALDAQVGQLRKKLKELGVDKNTMVCFTSDNGPEGNPGKMRRRQGSAKNLRGRKRSLYEGGVRVPGIIEWPAKIKNSQTDIPAVTSDYFPTICEALGYKLRDKRPIDGISLLKIFDGKMNKRNANIGFQYKGHKQRALTGDRYKLVQNFGKKRPKSDNGTVKFEEFELYDLIEDPAETKNIAKQNPKLLKQMKKELRKFVESCAKSNRGEDY
jgi:arylsulfatase A-like enzyme